MLTNVCQQAPPSGTDHMTVLERKAAGDVHPCSPSRNARPFPIKMILQLWVCGRLM